MQDFLTFFSSVFDIFADFLMTEPIYWFVGVFLLLAVFGILKRLIT